MTALQKMTEVFVVISPFSGEEPTTFRVAIREEQLRDVLAHSSYGEQIFASFKKNACEALELDVDKCIIGMAVPNVKKLDRAETRRRLGLYTGDVSNGIFLLH